MQIKKATVTPVELKLREPVRMSGISQINHVTAVFVQIETIQGHTAWGCGVAHPELNGQQPDQVVNACQKAADMIPDLHPTNIEYTFSYLAPILEKIPAALCAFDLAFYDLLGLTAGMPLYRLLGGYRNKIQTSATVPLGTLDESLEIAQMRVRHGFRMLKVKGGFDPQEDIQRIKAIHRALPGITIRLDVDGGYNIQDALEVARTLGERVEMLEQPTPGGDPDGLLQVTRNSPVPVLADQSIRGPKSALELAAHRNADGFSIKIGSCGGLRNARLMEGIVRAAGILMMVSCLIEPALLISAGLSFALSSPSVQYADLDGHIDLINDPTLPSFILEEGWLIATDVPGLGCTVDL